MSIVGAPQSIGAVLRIAGMLPCQGVRKRNENGMKVSLQLVNAAVIMPVGIIADRIDKNHILFSSRAGPSHEGTLPD